MEVSTRPKTVIQPSKGWFSLRLKELWDYRDLLFFLAWRDVKVRYKQSLLGVSWVVIQPMITMVIFSVIFGRLGKLPSDGAPYPLFSFCGVIIWTLFSQALTRSTQSVVGNSNLVKKVYFPRLIIPTSGVLSPLVDFVVVLAILAGIMIYYGHAPNVTVLATPLFVLLALFAALGCGLWLAALNARYRDIGHAVGFLVQAWMYASPVAYSISLIPERYQPIYALNPITGALEGFRWAILHTVPFPTVVLIISSCVTATALISGAIYYRATEKTFADVV